MAFIIAEAMVNVSCKPTTSSAMSLQSYGLSA